MTDRGRRLLARLASPTAWAAVMGGLTVVLLAGLVSLTGNDR